MVCGKKGRKVSKASTPSTVPYVSNPHSFFSSSAEGPPAPSCEGAASSALRMGQLLCCCFRVASKRAVRAGQKEEAPHRPTPSQHNTHSLALSPLQDTHAGQGRHSSCPPAASCCCTPAAPPTSLHVESSAPGTSLSLFRVRNGVFGRVGVGASDPSAPFPQLPSYRTNAIHANGRAAHLARVRTAHVRETGAVKPNQHAGCQERQRLRPARPSELSVAGPVLPLFWGGAPRRGRRLQPGRRPRCPLMIGRSDPACVVFE